RILDEFQPQQQYHKFQESQSPQTGIAFTDAADPVQNRDQEHLDDKLNDSVGYGIVKGVCQTENPGHCSDINVQRKQDKGQNVFSPDADLPDDLMQKGVDQVTEKNI